MQEASNTRRINYELNWARVVSDLLSPPVVWAFFVFPIAFRDAVSRQQAMLWALTYIVLVCLLPVVYIIMMVKRGLITDIHMKVRQQRMRPFMVSIVCTAFAWLVLRLMGAPTVVPLFALFSLVQLVVLALITLAWQISIHAVSIAGVMVAALVLFGLLPGLLTLPLVVLVGAARLKLKRHTIAQVVVGTLVGIVVPMLLFMVAAV